MRILSLVFIITAFLLAGCVYHQPIEQGNVLTQKKMQRIHSGMSKSTVLAVLGNPIMQNMYQDNRLVYVYTLQPSKNHLEKTRFMVTFRRGRVINTQTN